MVNLANETLKLKSDFVLDIESSRLQSAYGESYVEAVHTTTFTDFTTFTKRGIKALEILKCPTFEDAMLKLAADDFRETYRENTDLFLILIEIDEDIQNAMNTSFKSDDFKFNSGRPWIIQIISKDDGSSMIFYKEKEFSFINFFGKQLYTRGPQYEEHRFDELVSEIKKMRSLLPSFLDLNLTSQEISTLMMNPNFGTGLCLNFLNLIVKNCELEGPVEFLEVQKYNNLVNALSVRSRFVQDGYLAFVYDIKQYNGARVDFATQKKVFENSDIDDNVFRFMIGVRQTDDFIKLIRIAKQILTKEEMRSVLTEKDSEGSNLLFYANMFSDKKSFRRIFQTVRKVLDDENLIREMICDLNYNDENYLFAAAVNNSAESTEFCFEIAKTVLPLKTQRLLFSVVGINDQNVFCRATYNIKFAEVLKVLIKMASEVFYDDEIKSMLTAKSARGYNILVLVALQRDETALVALFEVLEKYLSKREIAELINDTNNFDENCFCIAVSANSSIFMTTFFGIMKTYLTRQQQIMLINKRGQIGRNVIHYVCANKNNEGVLTALIDLLDQTHTKEEIKSMITAKDLRESNILSILTNFDNKHIIRELFEVLRTFLGTKETDEMIFDDNIFGYNCLHNATIQASPDFLNSFFEALKTLLSVGKRNFLLKKRNGEGRNVFLIAPLNPDHNDILTTLVEIARRNLTTLEIKEMLMEYDEKRLNIAQLVASSQDQTSFERLFQTLVQFLSQKEIGKLLSAATKREGNKRRWFCGCF